MMRSWNIVIGSSAKSAASRRMSKVPPYNHGFYIHYSCIRYNKHSRLWPSTGYLVKVAFIGVGNMGKPMARNVVKGGYEVFLFDADTSRTAAAAAEIGAAPLAYLYQTGIAEIIVTMLPDGHAVQAVALGDNGIASVAKPGSILIDMSSSQPMLTRATGAALRARDITLIDAPVSGGVAKAIAGTLTIMIGSDNAPALARAKPVLGCMGTTFFEVGGPGSGHAAKALNNVVAAANYAVLAEALLTAERYGIEPEVFIDIVSASTGQSFLSSVVMKNFVLTKKFNTGFAVGLLAKDAAIAAELCNELGFDAPHIALASRRWAQARDALGAGEDNSKAISVWRGTPPD
jgi:3-hydroxyisobutyrate dehydrogenase